MTIPYRTRRVCKRIFSVLLALCLVAVFVLLCWLLWLDRFLVYTKDGVYLDFSQSNKLMSGALTGDTEPRPTVPIRYGDDDVGQSGKLQQLKGFYITEDDLAAPQASRTPQETSAQNIDALIEKVKTLPAGTPVMLEVKNSKGRFFYSSAVGSQRSSLINTAKVEELINALNAQNVYLIAKLPAFRDYYFGLNNVPLGLHHTSGRYLWQDEGGCYWLNPAHQGTLTYLAQIVTELKSKGFDEVVFSDFRFPDTNNILFDGNREDTIRSAASTLVTACATDNFCVSFIGNVDFPLPEGRARLYMENISAGDCTSVAGQTGLETPEINLVFIAKSPDTRYDSYGVLRPLGWN
ncbi:MAG: hypothetical protein IJD63_01160 [Oscillospiraceae bacterium]|nr:hypothetical protein [Oscillospiraceae bacterium]